MRHLSFEVSLNRGWALSSQFTPKNTLFGEGGEIRSKNYLRLTQRKFQSEFAKSFLRYGGKGGGDRTQ